MVEADAVVHARPSDLGRGGSPSDSGSDGPGAGGGGEHGGGDVAAKGVVAIVDDEEDILTYLEMALEDNGYTVVTGSNAADGMKVLEDAQPDVIFLDLLMPGHTGVSLYSWIVRHPTLQSRKTVIMSGLAAARELPAILERAGNLPEPAAFLDKPIDIEVFLKTVEGLLGGTADGAS